jgi:hypothetical protein
MITEWKTKGIQFMRNCVYANIQTGIELGKMAAFYGFKIQIIIARAGDSINIAYFCLSDSYDKNKFIQAISFDYEN